MQRWYVKAPDQGNAAERASTLNVDGVLESTSSQVNPLDALPHVIVQTRLGENYVFPEPVTLAALDSVQDEPETPEEAAGLAKLLLHRNARTRLTVLKAQGAITWSAAEQAEVFSTMLGLLGID